jgi:Aerotolerance regulator N-terminal/von Willebrand factor type A domain
VGFFAPWFLAGIIAAGIPLWLHLIRQYRRTPQPFSSLMFFERRLQSSVKHRRLRYLLLLALRLALLILLALAFANPFVNRTTAATTRRMLTVIAIDRSFSMRYGDNIQRAKSQARRLIEALRGRDLAEVIAVDSHVEALTQPEADRGILSAAVDSIQADDGASSFGEFARSLRVIEQTTGMRLNVHFISDMQQTSMPANFLDLAVGPHTTLHFHCIGGDRAPNWAVETVTAPELYDPAHTRVTATIAGWDTPAASRNASLILNGKVIASKDVDIPANGHAEVEFTSFDVPYGAHHWAIRIEPHDELPNDDEFPFSMERSDPRKILFLYERGRTREAFYYRAAMESVSDTGLKLRTAPVEETSGDDFSKYAFVVLGDVSGIDQILERRIGEYVNKGGSLLISVGPKTERSGRIAITGDRVTGTDERQGAGFLDNQDPALLGVGRLENVQFSRTARISVTPSARVIAKFADGSPLILEQNVGEGHVLTFASTLDNAENDFCLHPSFLPFVVQTGRYLSGAEAMTLNVVIGASAQLRRARDQGTAADVIGPDGKHELSLADATKALTFDLEREGFYEVQRADGRRMLLAAHADRRESDLTRVPGETLALWRNTGEKAAEDRAGTMERQIQPWSLWRYALIAVLVMALVESVFASRYLKKEESKA